MMIDRTPFQATLEERVPSGLGGRWYGVYPALVKETSTGDKQGIVQVTLPWSPDTTSGDGYEAWARVAVPMAGKDRGMWFMPEKGDEVLIAFEGGNPVRPYVVGALWNGVDSAPASMDKQNNLKVLRSRRGVKITLDDHDGNVKLILETPHRTITLDDGASKLEIGDDQGNSIKLEASGITITTSGQFQVNASSVTLGAGTITGNAGEAKFTGLLVASSSVQTPSITAGSYSTGAGNIW
jgi:uncharacterized protein involved in type VI secretion and phage assembly